MSAVSFPSSPRPSRSEVVAALAIAALALALRIPLLGRSLHGDEIWTVVDFIEAPSIWQTITRVVDFNNHHFYSLLARGAEAVMGQAEWVVRLPALLFGLLTVPAIWLGLRREFGPRIALLASLLVATASVHIAYSATARGYTGLVFFTWCASVLFLQLVREDGGPPRAALFAVTSALGIWTHLYAAVALAVQVGVLAILAALELRAGARPAALSRLRVAATGVGWAVLIAAVLYAPVLPKLLPTLLSASHGSPFQPLFPVAVLTELVGQRPINATGLFLATMALAGLASGLRMRWLYALYVALLFTVPIGAVWLARPAVMRTRFFLFLIPFLSLGLALAAEAAWRATGEKRREAAGLPLKAGAVAFVALAAWLWVSRPWSNVPTGGYREAVAALEAPPSRPGARVGACAIGWRPHLYAWYAKRSILVPGSVEEFESFVMSHDAVRCARSVGSVYLSAHQAIVALLESRCSPPERYFPILVYRCER